MQVPGSETSVIVSWDRSDASVVTNYTVYYSQIPCTKKQANEMSVAVPSTESSVRIDGLMSGAVYQFQIIVAIMFLGVPLEGGRSEQNDTSMIMLEPTSPTITEAPEPDGCKGGMYCSYILINIHQCLYFT